MAGALNFSTAGNTMALVRPWCVSKSAPTIWLIAWTRPNPLRNDTPARQAPTCIPPRATKLPGSSTALGNQRPMSASASSATPSHIG